MDKGFEGVFNGIYQYGYITNIIIITVYIFGLHLEGWDFCKSLTGYMRNYIRDINKPNKKFCIICTTEIPIGTNRKYCLECAKEVKLENDRRIQKERYYNSRK